MTTPADMPSAATKPKRKSFGFLIVLSAIGLAISVPAGLLFILAVAIDGVLEAGDIQRAILSILPLIGFLASFILALIGLKKNSRLLFFGSAALIVSAASTLVFHPGLRIATGVAAAMAPRPLRVEQVNFPFTVRKEREISSTPENEVHGALGLAWSADGRRIAAHIFPTNQTVVWTRSGQELSRFKSGGLPDTGSLAFIAGSSRIMVPYNGHVGDNGVLLSVFDAATSRRLQTVDNPRPKEKGPVDPPLSVSFDQQHVAMALFDSDEVAVADTSRWAFDKVYRVHRGPSAISFAANNKDLVVGSLDGVVTEIDIATSHPPREWHALTGTAGGTNPMPPFVKSIAASPDGRLIFAGGDLFVEDRPVPAVVLRTSDGVRIASFPKARGGAIRQAAWDPQGRYVAFLDDLNHVFLWQPLAPSLSYTEITLPDDTGHANAIALAPDGQHILTTTEDGLIIFSVGPS